VTPRIVARDARALVAFICDLFGARAAYEPDTPAIVSLGDSKLMVSDAGARGPANAFLYVYVGDADAAYRHALELGATSIEPPFDTPYGDRRCMFDDPWGNTWQVATYGEGAGETGVTASASDVGSGVEAQRQASPQAT